jgi:MFS family permease
MFQIGYLITAPVVGATMHRVGRKKYIIIGFIAIIIATVGLGILSEVKHKLTAYVSLAIIMRLIQGCGDSCITTSVYSIIMMRFPDRKERFLGYCSTAVGLGMMLGPVLGSVLYTFLAFEWTFYVFAFILSIIFVITLVMIPSELDRKSEGRS